MTDYGVLLQQVINGLSLGAMYALLALGFTLVYGILELIMNTLKWAKLISSRMP